MNLTLLREKKYRWYKYLAVLGLLLCAYQIGSIAFTLKQAFNLALVIYTVQIAALMLVVQLCVRLLRRKE